METVTLTVTGSVTIEGIDVTETENVTLTVKPVTTAFLGRTVVTSTLQPPLVGVAVSFLGRDGTGTPNGCQGQIVSDAAGNFALTNLPLDCVGPQLIRYDGSTATFPPGVYAGVDLLYTIMADQATVSPVLVSLPRIDNAETFMIQQNHPTDQTIAFQSIPNLTAIVYAGTTLTLLDGTQPNPFPLSAVQIPVDRLPDEMPHPANTVSPFFVSFQPTNTMASQPVAVSFPNTLNTPPGRVNLFSQISRGGCRARIVGHPEVVEDSPHAALEMPHLLRHTVCAFGFDEAESEPSEPRDMFRTVTGAETAPVFIEVPVETIVTALLDTPMAPIGVENLLGISLGRGTARDAIGEVR